MLISTVGTLVAGTTGTISGTITDSKTQKGLAGVSVDAVAPTGQYKTKTDDKGFFSFTGVAPDTYTVSFELNGYQPASFTGVNVFADQTANVSTSIIKSLAVIGRVTSRSQGAAFQPKQTQDTYNVTQQQITQLLGKADATSETNLLTRLPGVQADKYGYPVLRGGRETDEGFQYEGIDYVDAFTSQFTNNLALNPSVGQLQVTPGAGDATTGNSGTGTINLIAKRGTYPGFGSIDAEAVLQPYAHQLGLEYGWASPNGAISNYISFLGQNNGFQVGSRGTPTTNYSTGTYYGNNLYTQRDITDNLVFKFGKNQNQSLQFFIDNQTVSFTGLYGGNAGNILYPSADPYALSLIPSDFPPASFFGQPSAAAIAQYLPLLPGQTSATEVLDKGGAQQYQPNNVEKIQYTNNLTPSTFLSLKYYQTDATATFDYPYDVAAAGSLFGTAFNALQGGHRTGFALDISDQVNKVNAVQIGGRFDFLKPTYNSVDPYSGLGAISGDQNGPEYLDFIPPNSPLCPPSVAGDCGYLYQFTNNPGQWPYNNEQTVTNEHNYAFYLRDKITPNDHLNIDLGVRFDGAKIGLPGLTPGCNPTAMQAYNTSLQVPGGIPDDCLYAPSGFTSASVNGTTVQVPFTTVSKDQTNPLIFEPRVAVSYQLGANDAVRASFGRSVQFAPLAFTDVYAANTLPQFNNVPSYLNPAYIAVFGGSPGPAYYCGVTGNLQCSNYADQIRWEEQNFLEGVPLQPVKPETFTNWEFSYSHQFPSNISVKITPFYRRGYDQLALVAQPRTINGVIQTDPNTGNIILGPTTATNLGQNRTTGVEFYLTRQVAYGLSGSLSGTYINEFSNVVPNPLIQEDFFPPIPTQSLQLGNQYRVGFLSPLSAALSLSYKSHSGFRVNPIVTYQRGFPLGVGTVTAAYVGGQPFNIPSTNTSTGNAFGTTYAPQYVDPQNPGSVFKPNIAAARGTPETSSAGGILENARFNTSIDLEYNLPGSKSTFGVLITNVFNQLYGLPAYNSRYQPVATGISGPKSGMSTLPLAYPNYGFTQYLPSQFGQDPYRIIPSGTPQTVRLYYQLAL